MEYEGAGSFWSQLTITEENQIGACITSRIIDDLLRNPSSSIFDIISDDEAISEFRSGNTKMISRLTASDGIDALLNLVTLQNLPADLPETTRVHLPFIASELIACEIDALLDTFTREVPGQRNALDRLFDFLILGEVSDPTILGYVVRVLLVLINRRAATVDLYVKTHLEAIQEGLLELMSDRSVADLVFRLCLDESTKSFKLDYIKLVSRISPENAVNVLWLLDSMFGKPLLGNNEQVIANFLNLAKDFQERGGLEIAFAKCFDSNMQVSSCAFDILSILIQYAFTRPTQAESGLSEPVGWDTFSSTVPQPSSRMTIDDDSCVFDDEMNSPVSVGASSPGTPFTVFGTILVSQGTGLLNEQGINFFKNHSLNSISNLFSLVRFVSRCAQYQADALRLSPALISEISVNSLARYQKSSAVHNLVRDCALFTNDLSDITEIARSFTPFAIQNLESDSMKSHLMKILFHFESKLGFEVLVEIAGEDNRTVIARAVQKWKEIDTRLVDRQDKVPTRTSSPQGVTPIIDLNVGDQWQSVDFPFPEAHSPQVRFDDEENVEI